MPILPLSEVKYRYIKYRAKQKMAEAAVGGIRLFDDTTCKVCCLA